MTPDDTGKKTHDSQLRAAAEARLGNALQPESETRPTEELLHELMVHQIELEMQNEALRQAQLSQERQNEILHQAQFALEVSRDRYVDLYEFAPVGYLTLTPDGIIAEINLTATTLLGRERKNLLSKRLHTLVITEDQDKWAQHFLSVKNQEGQSAVELAMQRGDGEIFHARLDCVPHKSLVRITLLDITRRKLAEDELRIAAVAFSSQNGIMITDPKAVIQRVNPAFTQLTGYSAEEAIGQTPAMLHSGRQGSLFYQQMWNELKEKGYWQGEIWNKRRNGNIYAGLLTITAIYSHDQSITHFVGSFTDITDIKDAEAEIHRLAYYDPLTQLPNRRLLQDRLKQAIAATARSKLYGALFFIDLDRFKALNDTRGHDVGDLLLVDVAQRLRESVRENDTVARQGGDEFVVLMEELSATTNEAAVLADQLGNKVHAALDIPFNLHGYEYHCMSSIGVDLFNTHDTVESLFKHADLALYQAKNSGRDKLYFFNPAMQDAIDRRSIMESALQKVLALKQLRLYYQPQLNAARCVVGVEALLRWQHPQRGLVPPDDFIPLAEDSGLILPIGRWVMETACAQIKVWENEAYTHELKIAVNVSARQFRQPDFVAQVQNVLVASGANPACLKLELTESMLLEDVKDTIAKMQAIKQMGVCFSLDDFGTGYSSLSYLAQLPLDQIKIDKAFVRNLPGVTKDETIARAIITMGLGLNLNVIAEGVETESQREFLEAHGCQEYQGYLFSRPLPIEALEIFLQRV
jgi:diguanylate cyclase (GGDEF)-like protein/PAS domain S-box-containing protein